MSRTYKDTPVWVKIAREKVHAGWVHNQFLIGRKSYRTIPARDETGNFIYEKTVWTDEILTGGWEDSDGLIHNKWKTVVREGWNPVYVKVLSRQYKNYCTCGIEADKTTNLLNPCKKILTRTVKTSWYQNQFINEDHVGGRKNTRKVLKQAAHAYNTLNEEAFDTDDFEDVYSTRPPLVWEH